MMRLTPALLLSVVVSTAAFGDPPDLPEPISPQAGAVQITDQPQPPSQPVYQFFQGFPRQIERIVVQRTAPEPPVAQQFTPVPPLPRPLKIHMQPVPVRRTVQILPTLQNLFQARPITAAIHESKARDKQRRQIQVDYWKANNIRITDSCEDGKKDIGLEYRAETIVLKNIPAKVALETINKQVLGKTTPKPQGSYTGQLKIELSFYAAKSKKTPAPTMVVDTKGNAIHVIATPAQLAAIQKCVKEIDRSPKQYVFEIRIREIVKGQPGRVISAPQIVTTAGQKARVEVSGASEFIELNAFVKAKKATPPKPVHVDVVGRTQVSPYPEPGTARIRPASATKEVEQKANPYDVEEVPAPQSEPEQPSGKLITQVYSIADRIIPIPGPNEKLKEDKAAYKANAEALMTVIRTTILPNSWTERGGECAVVYYPASFSLVVRQTETGHKQIEKLLTAMREIEKQSKK